MTHGSTTRGTRSQRGIALLAALLAALAVAPSGISSPANHLTPILNCVDVNGDGSVTAHFGYTNAWTNQVNVPAGKMPPGQQNWFLPSPEDRGQPSQFQVGTYNDVFTVTFTPTAGNPTLEWRLGDVNGEYNSVLASADSSRCTPVPAFGIDSPWPVVAAVLALGAFLAVRVRTTAVAR